MIDEEDEPVLKLSNVEIGPAAFAGPGALVTRAVTRRGAAEGGAAYRRKYRSGISGENSVATIDEACGTRTYGRRIATGSLAISAVTGIAAGSSVRSRTDSCRDVFSYCRYRGAARMHDVCANHAPAWRKLNRFLLRLARRALWRSRCSRCGGNTGKDPLRKEDAERMDVERTIPRNCERANKSCSRHLRISQPKMPP